MMGFLARKSACKRLIRSTLLVSTAHHVTIFGTRQCTFVRTADVPDLYRTPTPILVVWLLRTDGVTDPYCTPASVLMMCLLHTDGVTDPYCTSASLLMIASSVLHTLCHTAYASPYCIPSTVLHIVATAGRQQTCLPRWRKELAARIKGDVL